MVIASGDPGVAQKACESGADLGPCVGLEGMAPVSKRSAQPIVAVLGIGNSLCRDDGAGGLVVEALRQRGGSPLGVTMLDAGTIGLPLLGVIQDHDAVVFVDAARMGRPPGSVGVFEGEAMDRFATAGKPSSVHEVTLATLLQAAALTDSLPRHRALVGVEPRDVSLGTEPSAEVSGAIEEACQAVDTLIRRWKTDA